MSGAFLYSRISAKSVATNHGSPYFRTFLMALFSKENVCIALLMVCSFVKSLVIEIGYGDARCLCRFGSPFGVEWSGGYARKLAFLACLRRLSRMVFVFMLLY